MRRNVKNDKVLRAIAIGLATMIAVTGTPVTVFAEGTNENTQQPTNREGQNNTAKTDEEKTSEAIDEAQAIHDNVSGTTETNPQGVDAADEVTQDAVDKLQENVKDAEQKDPTEYEKIIEFNDLAANEEDTAGNDQNGQTLEVNIPNFVSEEENTALNGEGGVFALAGELEAQVGSNDTNVPGVPQQIAANAEHLVGNGTVGTGDEKTNENLTAMNDSLETIKGIDEKRSQKDENDKNDDDRLSEALTKIGDLVSDINNNPEEWFGIEGYNKLVSDAEDASGAAEEKLNNAKTYAEVKGIVDDYNEKLRLAKEDRDTKLGRLSSLRTELQTAQATLKLALQDYSDYNDAVDSFNNNKTTAIGYINTGKETISSLYNKVNTLLNKVNEAEAAYKSADGKVKTALSAYITSINTGLESANKTLEKLGEPTEDERIKAEKLASVKELEDAKKTAEGMYRDLVKPEDPNALDLSNEDTEDWHYLYERAGSINQYQSEYNEADELIKLREDEDDRKNKLNAYNQAKSIYGEKAADVSNLEWRYTMAEYMGASPSVKAEAYDAWQEALDAEKIINSAASDFAAADEKFVSGLIKRNIKESLRYDIYHDDKLPEITVTKGEHNDFLDKDVYVASYTKEDENGNEVTSTISYIYDTVTDGDKEWIEIKPVEKVNVKTGEGKYISTDYGCSDGKDFVFQSDRDVVEGSIWYEDIFWTDSGEYWYSKVHYQYVHHGRNDTKEIIDAVVEDPQFADLKPDQRYLAVYKYDKSYQPVEGKDSFSEKAFYEKNKDVHFDDEVIAQLTLAQTAADFLQKMNDYNLKKKVTDYTAASEYVSDNTPKINALRTFLAECGDTLDYGDRLQLYGTLKEACGKELSNLNVYTGKYQNIYNAIVNMQAGNVKSTEVLKAQLKNLTSLLGVKPENLADGAAEEGGILNYLKKLIDDNDGRINELEGFIERLEELAYGAELRIARQNAVTYQGGIPQNKDFKFKIDDDNDNDGGSSSSASSSLGSDTVTGTGTGSFVTYTTPENEFTLIPLSDAGAGAGAQAGGRLVANNRVADRSGVLGVKNEASNQTTDSNKSGGDTNQSGDSSSTGTKSGSNEQKLVKVQNSLVPLSDTPFDEGAGAGMNWMWLAGIGAAAGAGALSFTGLRKKISINDETKKYKK